MKKTPLHQVHLDLSAKMGEFAGYDMPLYYAEGVLKEHNWVRHHVGLFDVSHMGQIILSGAGTAQFLEQLTPSAFQNSKPYVAKYSVLTNAQNGIIDDLIVTRLNDDTFFAVINAGCKDKDIAWITSQLPPGIDLHYLEDRALIAVQGPQTELVLKEVCGVDLSSLAYMRMTEATIAGADVFISRLGYTGEDGFEISIPADAAVTLWQTLLRHAEAKPIGLAARDSLRLEMGYCLYGHDIDATTTPLEADLGWVIRKTDAPAFPEPLRKRVGIKLTDKGVAREGAEIRTLEDHKIGTLTSGNFSPTLQYSIGQGYVEIAYAAPGTQLFVNVRGNNIAAVVETMPFVPAKTKKERIQK